MRAWRITLPASMDLANKDRGETDPYVLEGDGPLPVAERLGVTLPGDPADPPPGDDPPPPPEVEDDSPFNWPGQPPTSTTDPVTTRPVRVGVDPWTGEPFFAAQMDEANPLPRIYMSAGPLPDGRRLWAPALAKPSLIRRLLKTGHV